MNNKLITIVAIVIIIILGGFWYAQKDKAVTPATGEPVKVGAALALTGYASVWGEVERNSIQMAVDETNDNGGIDGRPIELVVEDIQSDNAKSVTAVSKLINIDKVKYIIGPTWADSFGGALPLVADKKIVTITPSASITAMRAISDSPYIFSTYYRTDDQAKKLVEYLVDSNQKNIVLLFENDPFWQDIASHIKQYAVGSSIEIIEEYKTNPGDTDFRTQLIKIKQLNPDVVLFGLNGDDSLLPFIKQQNEVAAGLKLFTTESMEEYVLKSGFKGLTENLHLISPKSPDSSFNKKYESLYNSSPVFSGANAYDAANILFESMKKSGLEPDEISSYLKSTKFETVTFGGVRFDAIGGIEGSKFVIKSAKNNELSVIDEL